MSSEEIAELRRLHDERIARYTNEAVALLNSSYPEMEIDRARLTVNSMSEIYYQINTLEYIDINLVYRYADTRETDLGYKLNWSEKYDEDYQLFETSSHIIHAQIMGGSAYTSFFSKLTGAQAKGKRHFRDIKTSAKGSYIVLNGIRFYFDKSRREHGAGEKPSIIARLQDNIQAISKEKQEREHTPKRDGGPDL